MRISSIALALSIFLAVNGHPQSQVTFCELVRNPELYNGKEVTVRATYKYGFEWQMLYCLDCLDKGKAWLEIPSELDDASRKALKRAPKGAGTINLTVEGIFMSGSTYGHQNMYHYKFVARKISDVAVVIKGMKTLADEEEAEKLWACGGLHPK
jgi:hypothetical protein